MTKERRAGLLGALALGLAGCLVSEEVCTPADSTYSCCLQQNSATPAACGASGTAVAVGTLTVAATLSSDGELFTGKLRAAVEKVLSECAREAHAAVNRRYFRGDPTWEQCEEVLSKGSDGKSVTRAMQLGEEKHAEAALCAQARLSTLIPGRFVLEQSYRIDPMTDQLELITPERYQELLKKDQGRALKGSVRPDVVIHSGRPLEPQLVYDFKFPCYSQTLPKWKRYSQGHPHSSKNQGQVYEETFKVTVYRITPWEIFR